MIVFFAELLFIDKSAVDPGTYDHLCKVPRFFRCGNGSHQLETFDVFLFESVKPAARNQRRGCDLLKTLNESRPCRRRLLGGADKVTVELNHTVAVEQIHFVDRQMEQIDIVIRDIGITEFASVVHAQSPADHKSVFGASPAARHGVAALYSRHMGAQTFDGIVAAERSCPLGPAGVGRACQSDPFVAPGLLNDPVDRIFPVMFLVTHLGGEKLPFA